MNDAHISDVQQPDMNLTPEQIQAIQSENLIGLAGTMNDMLIDSITGAFGKESLNSEQLDQIHFIVLEAFNEVAEVASLANVDAMMNLMGQIVKARRTLSPGALVLASLTATDNIVAGSDECISINFDGTAYDVIISFSMTKEHHEVSNITVVNPETRDVITVVGSNLSHYQIAEQRPGHGPGPLTSESYQIAYAALSQLDGLSAEERKLAFGKGYMFRKTYNRLMQLLDLESGADDHVTARAIPGHLVDRAIQRGFWPPELDSVSLGLVQNIIEDTDSVSDGVAGE